LDGDYVTLRQVSAYVAIWNDLSRFFLKRDGSTAMAGPLNFGNQKGINLADPDLAAPQDAVNVRSMLRTVATSGSSPVGIVADFIGVVPPTNWLLCDGSAYIGTAYPLLDTILDSSYKSGKAQGAIAASFPVLVLANAPVGILTLLPPLQPGIGYIAIPYIDVVNQDGGAAVTLQPTWNVTVTPTVLDGPNVTGGTLTIAIATGGTGIRPGAAIRIFNISAATFGGSNLSSLALLPAGYFRTPDFRGRSSVGAGTESKTPGIIDPPDIGKGDAYTADIRLIGQYGGEQAHQLTTAELATHFHNTFTAIGGVDNGGSARNFVGGSFGSPLIGTTANAGSDDAHNTMHPYHVLNKIIKAA
jgi:microcystin-dependent protein